jgi:hypothetical protein
MKNYQLIIGSPVDYEELTIDIVFSGVYVARIQKEEGIDKMKIEFFEELVNTSIYLEDFIAALAEAKEELKV